MGELLTGAERRQALICLGWRGLSSLVNSESVTGDIVLDDLTTRRGPDGPLTQPGLIPAGTDAIKAVGKWVRAGRRLNTGVWMVGPYGSGKSFALAWLVGAWPRAGVRLPQLVTESYLATGLANGDLRQDLLDAPLLAIDEVGARELPKGALSKLKDALELRHDRRRVTVFVANPTSDDEAARMVAARKSWSTVLRYGGRLWDRWTTGGRYPVVHCKAGGLRQDARLQAWLDEFEAGARARLLEERGGKPPTPAEIEAGFAKIRRAFAAMSRRALKVGARKHSDRAPRRSA